MGTTEKQFPQCYVKEAYLVDTYWSGTIWGNEPGLGDLTEDNNWFEREDGYFVLFKVTGNLGGIIQNCFFSWVVW